MIIIAVFFIQCALTLSLAARAGKLHKESLQSGSQLLNFEKICNPSLLSKNYFVLSSLLAKMTLYVSFFIKSNKKYNLEGSYAFHKKPPRRSKIWKKTYFRYSGRHQVHMNFQPSPPLPHLLQHLPRFLLLQRKKLYATLNFFCIIICIILFFKNFNKLIIRKR